MQETELVERWVKVLLSCVVASSFSITFALAVYSLEGLFFSFPQSFYVLSSIGCFSFALLLLAFAHVYFKRVERTLQEKSVLFRRVKQVGLQMLKMGLSFASLSTLPLAYLFLRSFLLTSNLIQLTVLYLHPLYLLQLILPIDVYISRLFFIICLCPASILLLEGLVLYKKM
ncbi:MAG: hypothetical protein QXP17_00590 [Candidatus Jordarchaeales archaeon]